MKKVLMLIRNQYCKTIKTQSVDFDSNFVRLKYGLKLIKCEKVTKHNAVVFQSCFKKISFIGQKLTVICLQNILKMK